MKNNKIFESYRGDIVEHIEDYSFPIEEQMVVTDCGHEVPNKRAIVRTDTNTVLGVVGSNYKVLPHTLALDPILDKLAEKHIKTFKRIALTSDGAKMFANIYFPKNDSVVASSYIDDKYWKGITVVNSLDGSLKYQVEASIFRLICTNGMKVLTPIDAFKKTHSKNKNFDEIVDQILDLVSDENRFAILNKWANDVLSIEAMILKATEILESNKNMFPGRYKDLVLEEIQTEAQFGVLSVWGLYNAFNSVLEHYMIREKGRYERARYIEANMFQLFLNIF